MRTAAIIGPELFPIPPIRGGAVELFIDETARRFSRWRPEVMGPSDPDLPHYEVRQGVAYHRISLGGWRGWLYRRRRQIFPFYDRGVGRLLAKLKPDLVHVHNRPLLARYLASRLPRGVPMILHMHNLYESLGRRERPQPGAPCRAEAFLGCSRFVLEREKDRLGRGAGLYRVVYNGVDAARYQPLWERPDLALAARRRWGVPEDAATVLFAGKLRESKGVHILLAAMEQVWPAMPQAALVLVGGTEFGRGRTMRETPFLRQFREQVAQTRGRVIMTGFVPPDEMPQAYLLGDVFAGPSQIEEGLGLVFLEAAAAGLPVIASRQGGIPEVVAHGDTGLLIKEKDNVPELAAAILQLLKDSGLRQTMGRQGRDRVVRHFTWERAAHTLEQLYDEISSL